MSNSFKLPDATNCPYNRLVVPQFIGPHWRTKLQQPLAAGTIEYIIYDKYWQDINGKRHYFWQERRNQ